MDQNEKKAFYDTLAQVNNDFHGMTLEKDHEIVSYCNDSSIRIWYNIYNTNYDAHWHTALEIIVPVENYYDVIIGNTSYHVMPGDVIIIPPGETHSLIAPENGTRFIYMFNISTIAAIKGFSSIQALLSSPIYITKAEYPYIYDDIHHLLNDMQNEYVSLSDYKELTIFSQLINFFVCIGKNHIETSNMFPNVRVYKQKEYIQKFSDVLDYIDLHYMDDLSLEDIASATGFSKFHFTRLFKQYTNSTFYDYLSYKRIKVAEELLIEPDLSITELALQAGFSSISTFNRTFKQQKHCTPSEYRVMYQRQTVDYRSGKNEKKKSPATM